MFHRFPSRFILGWAMLLILCLGFLIQSARAEVAGILLRAKETGTIFYVDAAGVRHPFVNQLVYRSWYGTDTSAVKTVPTRDLARYPLGSRITIRPGTMLLKFSTAATVYAIEQGGVLRPIADPEVAQSLYGSDWKRRVTILPDTWFGDYTVGQPLTRLGDVPDDVVLRMGDVYYFKQRDIVRPFGSFAALAANHLRLADAVVTGRSYYTRARPIVSFESSIFNPTAMPVVDRRDCENTHLKVAVLFVTNHKATDAEIANVENIKKQIAPYWNWATRGLSTLDTSYPTVVVAPDDASLIRQPDGTFELSNEVVQDFYAVHPDVFDFVIIVTNFPVTHVATGEIAHFVSVTNRIGGIGFDEANRSIFFGSWGKLKGIAVMGDGAQYDMSADANVSQVNNIFLHELLHQWGAYIPFADGVGMTATTSWALLAPDRQHWSYYAGFVSPLGGSGWIDNHDGTFSSSLNQVTDPNRRALSQLDLYLLGLIPRQFMSPIMYVEPTTPGMTGATISGTAHWVTIDQIIQANGQVRCLIPR